ncbi:ecto-NOX disulfide-thiol exchanger 2-like [Centruroides sculpturatus]|uniref:ecto-NOX disulfide-thiol exchanger 2-like n=1 Tax=Centruroides sculpturatus TaxID=218467 RepID=UPI000C6DDBDB|nr:ecto-NOX disulfide-thiol exchanger 2-like [Centruroides sculpturatus]
MQCQPFIGPQLPSSTLHIPPNQLVSSGNQTTVPSIDPATNDAPLEFNINKSNLTEKLDTQESTSQQNEEERWSHDKEQDRGCDRERSRERMREGRDKRTRERERDRNSREKDRDKGIPSLSNINTLNENVLPAVPGHISIVPHTGTLPGVLPGLNPSQWTINPTVNPFAMMGVTGDPNFLGVMGMAGFGQFGFMGCSDPGPLGTGSLVPRPIKEIIHLPSCVLYPPKPTAPPPTTRERPPGCRTVFVGGLPENITESIIREVFERCGEITTIRMSKKNFCHIRYENEMYIDNAIFLSGYRIKIEDKDEAAYTGRLHVDYAQARDDQYEWECHQRAFQRELRHRERLEQERLQPPSPPPIVHYSDHEASLLIDKLRGEESFQKAVLILITWLDRGECNKRNAGHFYSMIQSSYSHVRRLMNEKSQYEEELNKAKLLLQQRMQGILLQFNQIEKVFVAANHQKVWDHFTKAQRKNIDSWQKQTEEIKNAQLEEVLNEREEFEMELSDGEDGENQTAKKIRLEDDDAGKTNHDSNKEPHLQDENDSLRCQLEAYRNEVEVLRAENRQEQEARERQLRLLQQALQGMQQQLISITQQHTHDEEEIKRV